MKLRCIDSQGDVYEAGGWDSDALYARVCKNQLKAKQNLRALLDMGGDRAIPRAAPDSRSGYEHLNRETQLAMNFVERTRNGEEHVVVDPNRPVIAELGLHYYIGISQDPPQRLDQHRRTQFVLTEDVKEILAPGIERVEVIRVSDAWESMFVLYGGTTDLVRKMESSLVEYTDSNPLLTARASSRNKTGGGGGPLTGSRAFLYVLISHQL